MKYIKPFVYGILAGMCIGLGATVFLTLDNKIAGAVFLVGGFFAICTLGFDLFSVRVCYLVERGKDYALSLPFMWLGNLAGSWLIALAERNSRLAENLIGRASAVCGIKLGDNPWSILILAILCNLYIFIAAENYGNNPNPLGKYLGLLFGGTGFVLCGFEHSMVNMFFFSLAGVWSGKAFWYLIIMTIGNTIGGAVFPLMRKCKPKEKEA